VLHMSTLNRRGFIKAAGGAAAATLVAGRLPARAAAAPVPLGTGYVGNGTGGAAEAFPIGSVKLLDSAFRANQSRNTNYLHFVDPDRLLHTFRLNVGLPSSAQPCGGWETPTTELRGHSTGHLMSGLALTHANTGDSAVVEKGARIVAALAECQAASPAAGYHDGYLSAFPESFFDRLEADTGVWAPYYTIHKIMAGLIDQHQLAGNAQALTVATRLADWVDWRTSRLTYDQMQRALNTEFGGMMESLANLARITGRSRYLATAQRFDHARMFDPLERDEDRLAGNHANTQIPKMIGSARVWEETGKQRYRAVARNFWRIVVDHHTYIIGGNSDGEAFHEPDVIAGHLSNGTCENCNSYNMLKLTRLLHFHEPDRIELLDYYERTLFNQMLGEQDPQSEHGFNIYYTGLAPGAFKQQPGFMGPDPNVYSTDYDNFSCDHGTGMETQAKFADTIYSRDGKGVNVNLFIPSEVTWEERGITLRQETAFPDEPSTRIRVVDGSATLALRVRIPAWVAAAPRVRLNGQDRDHKAAPGDWLVLTRTWRKGDVVDITMPMALELNPTPDDPEVTAVTYGPVVLSGAYGDRAFMPMPRLDTGSIEKAEDALTFEAQADGETVELLPIARMHHQHYNTYWRTGPPPPPPPPFAAWYKLDETSGTAVADASAAGNDATLSGGAAWTAGKLGGAVALDGANGYVALPEGVITGAIAYSVAAWVKLDTLATWSRIFDFGTGTGANMFLTPRSGANTLRYAITIGGAGGEQQINAAPLTPGAWTHVAVTYDGSGVGILYVDGQEVGRNTAMQVVPQWFGSHVTRNYIGKSQYADPYLKGAVDDFRVYGRTLSPAEVSALAQGT
jgi:DUF1680 family protein